MESGLLGPKKQDAVLFNINGMSSDGYQTFNRQQRDAGYGKYQHRFSDKTSLSLYGGVVDIWNNTPNTTNPTRAQVAQFGDNYLLDNSPLLANGTPDPYYYKYNTYHVQTDFEYASFDSDLGGGWKFDTKAYTTRYWNKQFYQNGSKVVLTPDAPSGVDKLNGYRHAGDTLILSKEMKWGVFRTGTWYDWAYTDRYQIPSNIITQQNTPFGNFHEHFVTQSFQPFAEFEWHPLPRLVVTAGIKAADYKMNLNQYQDAKTVGCLGGTTVKAVAGVSPPLCIGGAAFTSHSVNYNNWLPTLTGRYRVWRTWSVYGQFAEGSVIPPSNVFDVPGGNVLVPPKPTTAKTYQGGTVLKFNRFTIDMDGYYVHFQNGYNSYVDALSNEPVFFPTGPSNTKGFEAEGTLAIGYGLSLYGNLSLGSAKYQTGKNYSNQGLWVANTPSNIEGLSLLWQHRNFDFGFTYKRVGQFYNDYGSSSQVIKIDPFDIENAFLNYTIKNASRFRGTKIQLAFNNIADSHNIVGITPASTTPATFTPSGGDLLNLLPGRSISLTVTGGWAPRR
jgi:iron complex outermembrane receptor protein